MWWIALLAACNTNPDEVVADVTLDTETACDPLAPVHCMLPFPSDRRLIEDSTTPTGFRLDYDPDSLMKGPDVTEVDTKPWSVMDGQSPAGQIMTSFGPPVDLSGVAFHDSIDLSIEEGHKTVLLDLTTGELIHHWVENDLQADDPNGTLVFIRPAKRLDENHRYAVAFRGLEAEGGGELPISDGFRAFRDGLTTDDEGFEARRASYEEMFEGLEAAGIGRDELQMAWWFHTASGEAIRKDLVAMRDDALERMGPEGIACEVNTIIEDYNNGSETSSWRYLRGRFKVPSYLDSYAPPSRLVRNDGGVPSYQRDEWANFTVAIPYSVRDAEGPMPLLTFGHGLMATGEPYMDSETFRKSAEDGSIVIGATDWIGMSTPDAPIVGSVLRDIGQFPLVNDRLQQAMINQIGLIRSLSGVCQDLPEFQREDKSHTISTTDRFFSGGSQGGILGPTVLALDPDIDRGALFVNGIGFPFTMERSIDFVPYTPLFQSAYPERNDRALALAFVQHLWDKSEGAGWVHLLNEGEPENGITPKRFVAIAAHDDPQVPNLSTDYAMRTANVPLLKGTSRTTWGMEVVEPTTANSGLVFFDFGQPDVPRGNLAPTEWSPGHDIVAFTAPAQVMLQSFFLEGVIDLECSDGICDPD